MASIKDLKRRIGTVSNTQQITRAMKMVSAAKLRRSQEAILAQRPYAIGIDRLIQILSQSEVSPESFPLLKNENLPAEKKERIVFLLCISSDRGLCGGFNANIMKKALRWVKENEGEYKKIELGFIGKKVREVLKLRGVVSGDNFYTEFGRRADIQKANEITKMIVNRFLTGDVHEVKFIYNGFKNAIMQDVWIEDFLPVNEKTLEAYFPKKTPEPTSEKKSNETEDTVDGYMIKPSIPEVLTALISKHFSAQVMRMLLESQASEHGARMAAMDNATNNAKDMIRSLTLQYNKQRQASITKELLEIISGAESQKGA